MTDQARSSPLLPCCRLNASGPRLDPTGTDPIPSREDAMVRPTRRLSLLLVISVAVVAAAVTTTVISVTGRSGTVISAAKVECDFTPWEDCSYAEAAEVSLVQRDLSGIVLFGADLRGADLRGANLTEADLTGADRCGAQLIETDLEGARLSGADLSEADLYLARLDHVLASHSRWRGAMMRTTQLRSTNLNGADLSDADLLGTLTSGTVFRNANLDGTLMPKDS